MTINRPEFFWTIVLIGRKDVVSNEEEQEMVLVNNKGVFGFGLTLPWDKKKEDEDNNNGNGNKRKQENLWLERNMNLYDLGTKHVKYIHSYI